MNKEEKKKNVFGMLGSVLSLNKLFEDGIPVQYLPKILYASCFLIFYIGNTHFAERTIREIDKIKNEVDDMRADYTTLKAELMYASKQSEVAKKTEKHGLYESSKPPIKILLNKGEY
jgi:hypothetical protein